MLQLSLFHLSVCCYLLINEWDLSNNERQIHMLWLSPPNWNVNSKSLVKPYFTSALLGPKSKGKGKWELVGKWVCTLDRRAIFSSSSSLSFSCSMSNCSKPWDKLKDSLNRRGVEQLESVSLSSEAIETIRSNSSFLDSSCCS